MFNHDIIVPARCEYIIPFEYHFGNDVYAMVEGSFSASHQYGIMLANCLVKCHNGRIPIRMLNPSDKQLVIPANRKIGRLIPFDIINNTELNERMEVALTTAPLSQEEFFELFNLNELKLAPKVLDRLQEILWKWRSAFAYGSEDDQMGSTDLVEHSIELTQERVIKQHPYRIPYAYREETKRIIDKMLRNGVISMSSSSYSSPVVLVRKKDGSLRFCVDYRKLNDITRKDVYPLPRIDDMMTLLSGNLYFSGLDAYNGFWHAKVKKEDRHKTAFSTPFGLYEFNRMPFGLCNAPATFQRLMDIVLAGLLWDICLVYMDDIIVFGRTMNISTISNEYSPLSSPPVSR